MAGLLGLDDDMRLALLTAGLGTLAGRGGPMRAAGQGGLLGVASYQNSKRDKEDARRLAMQEQLWQSQIAENQAQAEERRAKVQRDQAAIARRAGLDASAPRVGPTWNAPTPGYAPAVSEAFGVPAAQPQKTTFDQFQALVNRANHYADAGEMDIATKYYDAAEKFRKKYSPDLRTVVKDGKLVVVQSSDSGDVLTHEGLEPKPENQLVDMGGTQSIVDLLRAKPGTSYAKTPTIADQLAREQFTYKKSRDTAEDAAKAAAAKTPGGEKITESQGTAAVYLSMMAEANKTLEELGGKDAPYAATVNIAKSPAIGFAATSAGKRVAAAQMQWVEAALRITTGATAPPEEIVRMTRMYFPQIGDGPEVIQQKNAARAAFESGVRIKAGAGGPMAEKGVAAIGGSNGWSAVEVK